MNKAKKNKHTHVLKKVKHHCKVFVFTAVCKDFIAEVRKKK